MHDLRGRLTHNRKSGEDSSAIAQEMREEVCGVEVYLHRIGPRSVGDEMFECIVPCEEQPYGVAQRSCRIRWQFFQR